MDSLIEIEVDKYKDCMEYLKSDWPRGAIWYYFIEKQLEYHNRRIPTKIKLYSAYGEIKNGFVSISEDSKSQVNVMLNSCYENNDILEKALIETKLIDWKKKVQYEFIPTNCMHTMRRVMEVYKMLALDTISSFALILRRGNRLFDIKVPADVYIDKLKPEQAVEIDSVWPYKSPGSDEMFRQRIEVDRAYGIYLKEGDKLVSWVLMNELGFATHWYTIEEFRSNGYGELIMKYFSNLYLKEGKDLVAFSTFGNWPSLKLFLRMNWDVFGVFRFSWIPTRKTSVDKLMNSVFYIKPGGAGELGKNC